MDKEHRMLNAKSLRAQGYKQWEIAEMLGVTERTVRTYLKNPASPRKIPKRPSLLDPFKPFIRSIIEENPNYNCVVLCERLISQGYSGKISILRDYVAALRKRISTEAVIRFETEPGHQAQVDWKEYRRRRKNGKTEKIYAFVMTLGYSRKAFIFHTHSMRQSVLEACHRKAFEYFGGVPKEILYDNMKTAFVCDSEGRFHPNKRLLALAAHYGFVPKRCAIRRPQTKGKVERSIGYMVGNYWLRVSHQDLSLDTLNEEVLLWLESIDRKEIREFKASRNQRFEEEKPYMNHLPYVPYDYREMFERIVSRESMITHKTNRYSVPPEYIGKMVTLRVDPLTHAAEISFRGKRIRTIVLFPDGARKKLVVPEDWNKVNDLWLQQFFRRYSPRKKQSSRESTEIEVRHPEVYEKLFEQQQEAYPCKG